MNALVMDMMSTRDTKAIVGMDKTITKDIRAMDMEAMDMISTKDTKAMEAMDMMTTRDTRAMEAMDMTITKDTRVMEAMNMMTTKDTKAMGMDMITRVIVTAIMIIIDEKIKMCLGLK